MPEVRGNRRSNVTSDGLAGKTQTMQKHRQRRIGTTANDDFLRFGRPIGTEKRLKRSV